MRFSSSSFGFSAEYAARKAAGSIRRALSSSDTGGTGREGGREPAGRTNLQGAPTQHEVAATPTLRTQPAQGEESANPRGTWGGLLSKEGGEAAAQHGARAQRSGAAPAHLRSPLGR